MLEASKVLKYSYAICRNIGVKSEYTYEELDRYEALTSRFARLSDLIIQKVFRLIDELDLDNDGTIRDRINRAEKKGLIESAETFSIIRHLRNSIAHEYEPEAITEIFDQVLHLTPQILNCVDRVKNYCDKHGLN